MIRKFDGKDDKNTFGDITSGIESVLICIQIHWLRTLENIYQIGLLDFVESLAEFLYSQLFTYEKVKKRELIQNIRNSSWTNLLCFDKTQCISWQVCQELPRLNGCPVQSHTIWRYRLSFRTTWEGQQLTHKCLRISPSLTLCRVNTGRTVARKERYFFPQGAKISTDWVSLVLQGEKRLTLLMFKRACFGWARIRPSITLL